MPCICGTDIHASTTADAQVIVITDLFSSGYRPGRAQGNTIIAVDALLFKKDPIAVEFLQLGLGSGLSVNADPVEKTQRIEYRSFLSDTIHHVSLYEGFDTKK